MARRKTLVVAAAVTALFVGLLAAPLSATTVVLLGEDELVAAARAIVHGDVVSKRTAVAARGGRIYTEYRFRPREVLKGATDPDGTITFREWGGEANGIRYYIPGVGEFAEGDEVVAFLGEADSATGVGFTVGLSQGKFRVVREGGEARVRRDLARARLFSRETGEEVAPPPAEDERGLEAFKMAIRARLGR